MPKQNILNARQLKFVQNYLDGYGQTKSAIMAGYSEKSAKRHGFDLMHNPLVKAEIEKVQQAEIQKAKSLAMMKSYQAMRKLVDVIEDDEALDRDKIKASESILDRAGVVAPETNASTTTTNIFADFSKEDLENILKNGG